MKGKTRFPMAELDPDMCVCVCALVKLVLEMGHVEGMRLIVSVLLAGHVRHSRRGSIDVLN